MSQLVVYIVAHVGFINTSWLFDAWTCFGTVVVPASLWRAAGRVVCVCVSVIFNALYWDSRRSLVIWSNSSGVYHHAEKWGVIAENAGREICWFAWFSFSCSAVWSCSCLPWLLIWKMHVVPQCKMHSTVMHQTHGLLFFNLESVVRFLIPPLALRRCYASVNCLPVFSGQSESLVSDRSQPGLTGLCVFDYDSLSLDLYLPGCAVHC